MMLAPIKLDDDRLRYPGYYNISPITFEGSQYGTNLSLDNLGHDGLFLDENYGRIIHMNGMYGNSAVMPYYRRDFQDRVVDYLRVPMRKVPIYKFELYNQIQPFVDALTFEYPDQEILLRGQDQVFSITRSAEESKVLYGEEKVTEPSFYPTFARLNFNDFFIYNLWASFTAMMLDDIGIDLGSRLMPHQHQAYLKDVTAIKGHPHFMFIALGIAQHYGLPSIGLDLTKDLRVASWFATHKMITKDGMTTVAPISNFGGSTLFIFGCPKDQVFSHQRLKPKFIDHGRPDRQGAWFCHTGWGCAKNQIAENLIAAVRLDGSVLNEFDPTYHRSLFPDRSNDLMLNFFLDVKESGDLKGEAKRAFKRIYRLHELHF